MGIYDEGSFWEEEEEYNDQSALDFDLAAQHVVEMAPDVDTGLAAMRDLYTEFDYTNKNLAQKFLETRSSEVRQKFGERTPYNFDEAIERSPIQFSSIEGEGDDEDARRIDQINKWEEQSKQAITEIEDPAYLQDQSRYIRDIEKAAVAMRREIYGGNNYFVTDLALKFGEGVIGGPAAALGINEVQDYFQEQSNPEFEENHPYISAISSGFGQAGGAVAVGLATEGAGVLPYLAAGGFGEARKQYEEAKESGASEAEALGASAIEGVSQSAQALVGGKIFGAAVDRISGKVLSKLGTKVYPKVLGEAALESVTEGAGQVVSNYAESIGQGTEFDPLKGVGPAMVAGGFVAGTVSSISHGLQENAPPPEVETKPVTEETTEVPRSFGPQTQQESIEGRARNLLKNITSEQFKDLPEAADPQATLINVFDRADTAKQKLIAEQQALGTTDESGNFTITPGNEEKHAELQNKIVNLDDKIAVIQKASDLLLQEEVERVEGVPPPPKEAIRDRARPIELSGPATTVATLSDGTKLVDVNGQVHFQKGNVTYEGYDQSYAVSPETAQKLKNLEASTAPDGTGIHLVTENGKLYVESDFVGKDLESIATHADKSKLKRIEVKTEPTVQGNHIIGVSEVKQVNNTRRVKYEISDTPVASTAGAASIAMSETGAFGKKFDFAGKRESGYAANLRKQMSSEMAERVGLAVNSFEEDAEGNRTEVQHPIITQYEKSFKNETYPEASDFIAKRGIIGSLDYLSQQKSVNDTDVAAAGLLRRGLYDIVSQLPLTHPEAIAYTDLLNQAIAQEAQVREKAGRALRTAQLIDASPDAVAEGNIRMIQNLKLKEALNEFGEELGQKVNLADLRNAVKVADAEVTGATEAIKKEQQPVADEIARLEAEYKQIDDDAEAKDAKNKADVEKQLEDSIEREKVAQETYDVKTEEAKEKHDNVIRDLEKDIATTDAEVAKISKTKEAPYKKDVEAEKKVSSDLDKARREKAKLNAELVPLEGEPVKNKPNIKAKEAEVRAVEGKVKELQKQLEDIKNKAVDSKLTDKLSDLKKRLRDANKKAASEAKEAELDKLSADINDLQTEIDKQKNASDDLRTQLKEAKELEKTKQSELTALKNQASKIRRDIEKVNSKISVHQDKLASIRDSITSRTGVNKEVPRSLLQRAADLRKSLEDTKERRAKLDERSSENSEAIQKERKNQAELRRILKEFAENKKKPKEETTKQKAIKKDLIDYKKAQQEGRVKITKEAQDRLTNAVRAQNKAKANLTRIQKLFDEKMEKFSPKEQARLRQLYDYLKDAEPTDRLKLNNEILEIESKHLPITPDNVDMIWSYWRKNVLSGVNTASRNFFGNLSAPLSTTLAYGAKDLKGLIQHGPGDLVRLAKGETAKSDPAIYIQGLIKGFKERGIPEALEILKGNRRGRITQDFQVGGSEPPTPLRSIKGLTEAFTQPSLKNTGRAVATPINVLLDIAEVMNRSLGAVDAMFGNAAIQGQAHVAAKMLIAQGKLPNIKTIQEALYSTDTFAKETKARIAQRVATLKTAGIDITPREQNLMFAEAMEKNRADAIKKIAQRHGETNTFTNETHNTALGLIADGLSSAVENWKLPLGGGRVWKPGKMLLPFLRTTANIGDFWMQHSPVALGRTLDLHYKRKEIADRNIKGVEKVALKNQMEGTNEEFTPEIDPYELEAREHFGRMMVGTAGIVLLAGMFLNQDDENPRFKFHGAFDSKDRATKQAQGIPEFSLEINLPYFGRSYLTKEVLGPFVLTAAFADNVAKAIKRGDNMFHTAANTVMLSMGAIGSLSYLQDVNNFFQAISTGGGGLPRTESGEISWSNAGQKFAANLLQPLIPSSGFLRNVYQAYDGSPQETYNNLMAKLAANIPVAREYVGANRAINIFGEEIGKDLWERIPGNVLLGKVHSDPVFDWMQQTGHTISQPGPTLRMRKDERAAFGMRRQAGEYRDILSPEESYQVTKISGPQIKQYIYNVMSNPAFAVKTEQTQGMIDAAVNKYRAAARIQVLSMK